MTSSLMYNQPMNRGNWVSTVLWGRNQSMLDGNVGNSFLVESTVRFVTKNYAWMRIENVDRTNELLQTSPQLAGFTEKYFARIQAYTTGYDREFGHIPHLSTAIGGQVTWYGVPATLRPDYGSHPVAVLAFVRLRII